MLKKILNGALCFLSGLSGALAQDPWEISAVHSKSGYYDTNVVAMTWQPTYCLLKGLTPADPLCHNAFKLHSIWPYYALSDKTFTEKIKNYYPSYCLQSVGCPDGSVCQLLPSTLAFLRTDEQMQRTYPQSETLWAHEWEKHGTCSGLSQINYFRQATGYLAALRPTLNALTEFIKRHNNQFVSVAQVRALLPNHVALRCEFIGDTQYLLEINFLFNRQGAPQSPVRTQIGGLCQDRIKLSAFPTTK